MEERNITITLEEAKEWFNSKNATLKDLALQAFSAEEFEDNFRSIKTFKDACNALSINYSSICQLIVETSRYSKASAAMFKLNIIRKALNLGQDLRLTKNPKNSYIYYPCNPFVTMNSTHYQKELNSGKIEVIGRIKNEEKEYWILGNSYVYSSNDGLGNFFSSLGVGTATSNTGFLGCANKEIARHFSKYFGMLLTKAKYADLVDFEIISNIYGNT